MRSDDRKALEALKQLSFDDDLDPNTSYDLFAEIAMEYMNSEEFTSSVNKEQKGRLLLNILRFFQRRKKDK